jgi:hypothetical protein
MRKYVKAIDTGEIYEVREKPLTDANDRCRKCDNFKADCDGMETYFTNCLHFKEEQQ